MFSVREGLGLVVCGEGGELYACGESLGLAAVCGESLWLAVWLGLGLVLFVIYFYGAREDARKFLSPGK